MALVPPLAFLCATIAVVLHYLKLPDLALVPMAGTVVLALTGLVAGAKDHPVSSRVACVMAVVLGSTPITAPMIQALRLQQLSAQRAAQTRPLFQQLDDRVAALAPLAVDYYNLHRLYPDRRAGDWLPYVDTAGRLVMPPVDERLTVPADPFSRDNAALRWVAIRDHGILLVSVGQDGVAELPLPGVSMDPAPAHPLAGLAATGVDMRTRTFDPAKGALSLGDVVRWVGHVPMEETLAPLHAAWDLAEERSPFKPLPAKEKPAGKADPQSARDSEAAAKLLAEGHHLAALALASRALQLRSPHTAQWAPGDRTINLTRGLALYNLSSPREAADALIDHLDDDPNSVDARFYLAAALWQGGRRSDAVKHLAAASQINPAHPLVPLATRCYQEALAGRQPSFPAPQAPAQ